MPQPRLKGSFIYLANAVSDLRGNWSVLALVLAPMVLAAALCLLPEALNLQAKISGDFQPGTRSVGFVSTLPAAPNSSNPGRTFVRAISELPAGNDSSDVPSVPAQPYPRWFTETLHIVLIIPALLVTLLTLCALERIQSGRREAQIAGEAIAIYRRAIALFPAFLWVSVLQLGVPLGAVFLFEWTDAYITFLLMVVLGGLLYLWLYFAQYALIFNGLHSFHALLFSRDLMRKRFFKVSTRLVVFLAVWSGYNSWAVGVFIVVSLLASPLGAITGTLAATVFIIDFLAITVTFATTAFFVAAGLRLYQDLLPEPAALPQHASMLPTVSLAGH